jgi:hypothetical protein
MMELMIKLNNLLQEKVNQQAKKNLLYSLRSTDFRQLPKVNFKIQREGVPPPLWKEKH